jgi:hypothetical protein
MRCKRTIYYNDARHYYLFVFEPPMTLEDAWRPVDEAAGGAVDTFIYGVERGDGLYYPSKVGEQFKYGEHKTEFRQAAYWRTWNNMKSLSDRGLDPLTVLIDRAHDKGMDFFASVRLSSYGGMDPSYKLDGGGRGFAHQEVQDHQLAVLRELATDYATEGVELDFACSTTYFPPDDVEANRTVMTDWVRRVSEMVRSRHTGRGQIGARVFSTEKINLDTGLDVKAWLAEELVDYVTPMVYAANLTDSNLPIDWIIEAAHASDVSVYPMVQPDYYLEEERRFHTRERSTPAMMRAAAANYWDRGADGMYTWFLEWPLDESARQILADLSDPDIIKEKNKHYFLNRRTAASESAGYDAPLPVRFTPSDVGNPHRFSFYIADRIQEASDRIQRITLRMKFHDIVSADKITLKLNGESLAGEPCRRTFGETVAPYLGMWIEFDLQTVRPTHGHNDLEFVLDERAEGLLSPLTIEDVEIVVEYGSYQSSLH